MLQAFEHMYTDAMSELFKLMPWDPRVIEVSSRLVAEIKKATPELEVLFMGAAALELPGKNDIDLDILCKATDILKNTEKLNIVLGEPKQVNKDIAVWSFMLDGFEVDCLLSDPESSHVPEQRKVFDILSSNKTILEEYKNLKIKCDGRTTSEYDAAKKEFFKKITQGTGS